MLEHEQLDRRGEKLRLAGSRRTVRNRPAKIIFNHGECAAGEVAEAVCEVGIVAREQSIPREVAILAEYDLAQQVIAQRIVPNYADDRLRVSDIALRLAHFLLL